MSVQQTKFPEQQEKGNRGDHARKHSGRNGDEKDMAVAGIEARKTIRGRQGDRHHEYRADDAHDQ